MPSIHSARDTAKPDATRPVASIDPTPSTSNANTPTNEGKLALRAAGPHATGLPLVDLNASSSADGDSRFGAVPKEVVHIVAEFVSYPAQAALAATSREMHQKMRSAPAYMQVRAALSGVQNIRRMEQQLYELNAEMVELVRSMFDMNSDEFRDPEAGDPEAHLQEKRHVARAIEQTTDRRTRALALVNAQLASHVELYIATRATPQTRAFVLACDNFVAATTAASARAIFESDLRGHFLPQGSPNLAHWAVTVKELFLADDFAGIQALVREDVDGLRTGIADAMRRDWMRDLVEIFALPIAPAKAGGQAPSA